MFYTYILRSSNNTYYTGHSSNLKGRIQAHQKGQVTITKKHLPAKLVFYSAFNSKIKAVAFEKYLKTHSGFAFRNKRLV